MKKCLLFVFAAAMLSGCASGPSRGYRDTEEDVYGKASRMEYAQKHLLVTRLVERLLIDPVFTENYARACKRAGEAGRMRPVVTALPIENNTGDGVSDSAATGQIYRELLSALRKTGKFDVIDPTRQKQMTDAVISAANAGGDGSAIQSIGSYAGSDFVMTGSLRSEHTDDEDSQVYDHFLNLEMTDTATGTIFWSESSSVRKFDAR